MELILTRQHEPDAFPNTVQSPLYIPAALFAGLSSCQLLFTLLMYRDGRALHAVSIRIEQAGFLPVPSPDVLPGLMSLQAAAGGALFFTATLGTVLSLAGAAGAWLWIRYFGRRLPFLLLLFASWAGLLAWINHRGLTLTASTGPLVIIPVVFFLTGRWMPPVIKTSSVTLQRIRIAALCLTALAAGSVLSLDSPFTAIRDAVLLSSKPGTAINNLYYRHTLLPARALKPLEQRTLNTCRILARPQNGLVDPALIQRLKTLLSRHDYLPLDSPGPVDLTLVVNSKKVAFIHEDDQMLDAPVQAFLARPERWLATLSNQVDVLGPLRLLTLAGLLTGLPLVLFILCQGGMEAAAIRLKRPPVAAAVLSAAVIILGALVVSFTVIRFSRPSQTPDAPPEQGLTSPLIRERIHALKTLDKNQRSLPDPGTVTALADSPLIAQRYWTARVLGRFQGPAAFNTLTVLLRDPHPNVVCQALFGLGRQGNTAAVPLILELIRTSRHWYIQQYGYTALRRLSWQQRPLP